MRNTGRDSAAVGLIVSGGTLTVLLVCELISARGLLQTPGANWYDQYHRGTMAWIPVATTFVLVAVTFLELVSLAVLATARVRLTRPMWALLLAHLVLLLWVWVGAGVPQSAAEYWVQLVVWTACSVTGIATGVALRGATSIPVDQPERQPVPSGS